VLKIIRAMSPIALVIDEGDRSFGGGEGGETDGGTSSRVIARLKDFMSDPGNRGHVLTILMTNRPDRLDVDIKRPGRLDRKIPFFYADTAADRLRIVQAILKRNGAALPEADASALTEALEGLDGYSNADLEALALLAVEFAGREGGVLSEAVFARAVEDFMPPRETAMLGYMEMLAVFETSRRSLLPLRYRSLTPQEVQDRLAALRRQLNY